MPFMKDPMTLRCNTHFWPWLVRPRGGRKVHNIIFPPDITENGHYCWEMRALLGWNVLVQNWNEPLPCPLWRLTYHSKNYWKLSLVFPCWRRTKDILSKEVGFIHSVAKVYAVLPFYDVKCLCSGGREWGREESHSHYHFNIWFLWY